MLIRQHGHESVLQKLGLQHDDTIFLQMRPVACSDDKDAIG